MPSWFITGTNRGIGYEIVRQLVEDKENIVIAACRTPSTATKLEELKSSAKAQLHIVQLDVSDEQAIHNIAEPVKKILGDSGLDYLINNAAVTEGEDKAFSSTFAGIIRNVTSNVAGPAVLARSLLPFIEKGHRKVIVNTTSGLASFGLDFGDKNSTYTISKTAVNMLTYKQAKERSDLIVFCVDPGWVKTDMGGAGAMLEPHESVTPLLNFLKRASKEHSGGFWDYKGDAVPR